MNINITQEAAGTSKFHFSVTKTGLCKRKIAMFFRTGNSYIEQATFFFQCTRRISCHSTGKEIFFQPDHKYVLKFQSFSRMHGHQGYLFPVIRFIRVLIGKQGNLRKKIGQGNVRVTFFLPQSTKVIHPVHQLLDIFFPAQVFRRRILTDIIDDTGLTDNICSYFVCILIRLTGNKTLNQFTETLQFRMRPFIDIEPITQWFTKCRPKADAIIGSRRYNLSDSSIPDTTGRIINDTFERFFIIRIHHQPEVSNHILYLLTLVKRESSIYLIGHTSFPKCFLKNTALRIRSI